MAALLNIQNNIFYLDSLNQRYKLLYPKLSTLKDEEREELNNIKKEMVETLSQILANDCTSILENIFKEKSKLITQGIITVLNVKKEELEKFNTEQVKAIDIIGDIANSVCVLEMLQSNVVIRFDIEKLLFYLKNKVSIIGNIDKKLYALDYLRGKLSNYKTGLSKLLILARKRPSKTDISFEEKQEIFEAFSGISFEYHYDSNHSKVYNEDLKDKTSIDLNTTDYIKWYENLFLDMLSAVGVNLESYSNELINLVNDASVTKINFENYINFLEKKYNSDIVSYYDSIIEKKISSVKEIRKILRNSLYYDHNKDCKYIIDKINNTHRLPECLINSNYKKYLEDVLFGFEVNDNLKNVPNEALNEISNIMFEKFEPQKYLDIYEYNTKQKNKQINMFSDYLNDLLDQAKKVLLEKYINELENKIEKNMLIEYNTAKFNVDKKKKEREVSVLNKALQNVSDRFSIFDEYAYKKYISSIEECYSVENLSTEISARKKSIFMAIKPKNINKKDFEYINQFLRDDNINRVLVKNLIDDCVIGSDNMKYEILSKILD